jgi:hypothetical protein
MNAAPADLSGNGSPNSTAGKDDSGHEKVETGKALNSPGPKTPPPTPQKKKRKSPDKPWKKPADMPKRPLSAYNLFFQHERNRLKAEQHSQAAADAKAKSKKTGTKRKHEKVSGIGFASLAKLVAARWNSLDAETKAPFEERAGVDKARYDKAVAIWRVKHNKKKALEKAGKLVAAPASPPDDLVDVSPVDPSDHQSLESISVFEGAAADWYNTNHNPHLEDRPIPPHIQAMTDDSSRTYASSHDRMSPFRHDSSFADGQVQQRSPFSSSMPSPLQSIPPLPGQFGFHSIHNPPTGMHTARNPVPAFPGVQNPYNYNNPAPRSFHLSPRRSVANTNPSLDMSAMQSSGNPVMRMDPIGHQPVLAFPDPNSLDPIPLNESNSHLPHPSQQNPPFDPNSFQTGVSGGSLQQAFIGQMQQQLHSQSQQPFHGQSQQSFHGQLQQPFPTQEQQQHQFLQQQQHQFQTQMFAQQQYAQSQMFPQQQHLQSQMFPQQQQHQQPSQQQPPARAMARSPQPNFPNEYFDDPTIDFITRFRDPKDGDTPPSQRHFYGNP